MKHGQAILRAARLKSPKVYTGKCAPWAEWRLVLFGVEYEPIYKTELEWLTKFGHATEE